MSHVVTYANNDHQCFCQIRLSNGERIFIGMAARPTPNTKVWKQGFLGLFPIRIIWQFSVEMADDRADYLRTLMNMFDAYGPPMKHPLDAARDVLLNCGSVADVKAELDRRYEKSG